MTFLYPLPADSSDMNLKEPARLVLALFFLTAGILHFLRPDGFVRIVPPYLPNPLLLVQLSGAAEIAGALGLLVPATRLWAAWGCWCCWWPCFRPTCTCYKAMGQSRRCPTGRCGCACRCSWYSWPGCGGCGGENVCHPELTKDLITSE